MNTLYNTKVTKTNRITMFIALIAIALVIYISTGEYSLFRNIIQFLFASLSMAIVFMAFTKTYQEYGIFNYIGFGFSLICFFNIVGIILNIYSPDGRVMGLSDINIKLCENIIEYISVILGYIFIKHKFNIKFLVASYLAVLFLFEFFNLFIIRIEKNKEEYFSIIKYVWWCLPLLFVIALILTYKNTDIIGNDQSKYIRSYLVLVFIYESVERILFNFTLGEPILAYLIKYAAYYVLFRGLNKHLITRAYESMNATLLESENKNITLSKNLKFRLKLIDEYNYVLEKSEERYSRFVESIKDGLMIFQDDVVTYANSAVCDFVGKSIDNVKNISLNEILYKFKLKDINLDKGEVYSTSIEISINNEDKSLDIYLFKYEKNATILFIKDATEKIKNYSIRAKMKKYIEEENLKEQFFSNISHELRTPINVIFSSLQLKELYINQGNYNFISENSKIIKQNCLRLIRTINNFIDSNKISEGYIKANYGVYNIVEVVENIAQASLEYLKKLNMSLIFDAQEEEICIKCDSDFIQRVILNFLANAAKYGKENGNIYINIWIEEDKVYISFKSEGIPISDDIRPYIFDKFTKINKALNRAKEGSGLGLYLCKELIRIQGGDLTLSENIKDGNEFLITLKYERLDSYDISENSFEINKLMEKVDIEFSDVYIEDYSF